MVITNFDTNIRSTVKPFQDQMAETFKIDHNNHDHYPRMLNKSFVGVESSTNSISPPQWPDEFKFDPETQEYRLDSSYLEYDDSISLSSQDTLCSRVDEPASPFEVLNKLDNIIRDAESIVDDGYDDISNNSSNSIVSVRSARRVPSISGNRIRVEYQVVGGTSSSATGKFINPHFIRKVERFGCSVKDLCLFPLALPMDGSDIYHGRPSWESINLLADCILTLWTERRTPKNALSKGIKNNVLKNPIKHLCLRPEIVDALQFQDVHTKLPLRKCSSLIDMKSLTIQSSKMFDSSPKTLDPDLMLEIFSRQSKTEIKQLAFKAELQNPKRFALKLTKLEKANFLRITWKEILHTLFGKITCNNCNLNRMILFSQEVSHLVTCYVRTETSIEGQKQTIANMIEVAFILFLKRNFQSFESIMRGLCLPQVYGLQESWQSLYKNNPFHYKIYIYLSTLISYKAANPVEYSPQSSLPTLSSFIETLRAKSLAALTKHEEPIVWKQGKLIVEVITKYYYKEAYLQMKIQEEIYQEFRKKIKSAKKTKKRKISFRKFLRAKFPNEWKSLINKDVNRIDENAIDLLKMSTENCFLPNTLPDVWLLRSACHLTVWEHRILVKEFIQLFVEQINLIESFRFQIQV